MATARDLSYKITSLRNMQKVMSAMNMIASTKLRKLMIRQPALVQFSDAIDSIEYDIVSGLSASVCPLIDTPETINNIHFVVFTADKGLCGSHNSSVLKVLAKTIEKEKQDGVVADVTCIGARAKNFCRRHGYDIYHGIDSNDRHISDVALREIAAGIVKRIMQREVSRVLIIYNHFVSTLVQKTQQLQIFPASRNIDNKTVKEKEEFEIEAEPSLADFIIPAANLYFYYKLKVVLTDSYLSEHAARMTAMESAKTNSEDLINRYATIRNRARQSAITSELIEIVAGKEALES